MCLNGLLAKENRAERPVEPGCNAATVGEALGRLTGTFSDLKKHLFTDDGKIRSFVNVYLNDEDIRFLNKENTPTKDGDTISIVPSIAGGSAECGGIS